MRIDYGYRDCANIININYKDRDDVVDVVSKFIKENSLLNNLIG